MRSDPTISGTIHITVSGEAAVIDADYCGTYSGDDISGATVIVEVSPDGTIIVKNETSSETGTYTFSKKDGSYYYFKDGDGTETFKIYFTADELELSFSSEELEGTLTMYCGEYISLSK